MSQNISVHFLGTTSGGGPTETRNCSSLVVDPFAGNGELWMVDCAEGTVRQFERQPYRPGQQRLRPGQVNKIFITHMHADHTMGLLTFLRNTLGIPKPPGTTPANAPPPNKRRPRVEIFGPRGIRRMLRMLWHMTHTRSEFAYVVHELLFDGEQPSVAADVQDGQEGVDEADIRSESECVGQDIWCDRQGFWKGLVDVSSKQAHGLWGAVVDAGPIRHRDPCIGYMIREIPRYPLTIESPMPRKLVILGDTYDPSPILPLIHADDPPSAPPPSSLASTSESSSPTREPPPQIDFSVLPVVNPHDNGVCVRVPVSLLVHEATDAYLPPHVDPQGRTGKNRTPAGVAEKAVLRGHSTPAMAGAFARTIAAERLVMNHLGARFPAPDMEHHHHYHHGGGGRNQFRAACMREIERQAAEAWNPNRRMQPHVQAAWDFLTVAIPPNAPRPAMSGIVSSVDFAMRAEVAVEMVETTPARASEKGKERSFSMTAVEYREARMVEDGGGLERVKVAEMVSVSASASASEDEDEVEHGTTLAPTAGSAADPRGYGPGIDNEPGGSHRGPQTDTNNGEKKRRAPSDGGASNSRGGFRSGRARGDGSGGGGRGRGGDYRPEFSTRGGGGRDGSAPSSTSGRSRYQDRGRKSGTDERTQRGRGGGGS